MQGVSQSCFDDVVRVRHDPAWSGRLAAIGGPRGTKMITEQHRESCGKAPGILHVPGIRPSHG